MSAFKKRRSKELACACGTIVKNVDESTVKVTCWKCVIDGLRGYKQVEADRIEMIFDEVQEKEKKV